MNRYLIGAMLIIIFSFTGCSTVDKSENPFLGKWRSVWSKNVNKTDLTIIFDKDKKFRTEVVGGPAKYIIVGVYNVRQDTFLIKDDLHVPVKLCQYTDTGRYHFTQHNDTLFFKVIKDDCERRKLTFEIGLIKLK